MDLAAVRDGLKVRLETITGLRAHDTVPGTVNPPAAIVEPSPPFTYHEAMGSTSPLATFRFRVHVLVTAVSDRAGQDKLDAYCSTSGASSVRAAIEGDRTLGGTVADCVVLTCDEYGTAEAGSNTYYSATFTVEAKG